MVLLLNPFLHLVYRLGLWTRTGSRLILEMVYKYLCIPIIIHIGIKSPIIIIHSYSASKLYSVCIFAYLYAKTACNYSMQISNLHIIIDCQYS